MKHSFMASAAVAVVLGVTIISSSIFVVPDGHVGIVTSFGKAVKQVNPGLNFKVPFVQGVVEVETRERRNTETFQAATFDELPIEATVSVNWTVAKENDGALRMYQEFGGLDQFEERVIDPIFAQSVKAALSKYSAVKLVQNRTEVAAEISRITNMNMQRVPATLQSPQIDNFVMPPSYLDAIRLKEDERQKDQAETLRLARHAKTSQQKVQTAQAEAEAITLKAEAEAGAITLLGDAEADRIQKMIKAMSGTSGQLIVDLERAKVWDGVLPNIMMSPNTEILMGMDSLIKDSSVESQATPSVETTQ